MAYIEREKLIENIFKRVNNSAIQGWINRIINDIPTVDVVEVVRCKDCKYRDEMPNKNIWCAKHVVFMAMKPDDYCSKGERKDGE